MYRQQQEKNSEIIWFSWPLPKIKADEVEPCIYVLKPFNQQIFFFLVAQQKSLAINDKLKKKTNQQQQQQQYKIIANNL